MYTLIRQCGDNGAEHTEEITIYPPLIKYQISSVEITACTETDCEIRKVIVSKQMLLMSKLVRRVCSLRVFPCACTVNVTA